MGTSAAGDAAALLPEVLENPGNDSPPADRRGTVLFETKRFIIVASKA